MRDHLGGVATTVGYGPRFLHSTGQLHKGGPNTVVAVQIVDANPMPEVPIPGAPYDFGTLIAAQSIGDHRSLLAHGRRVLRVAVDDLERSGEAPAPTGLPDDVVGRAVSPGDDVTRTRTTKGRAT